MRPAPDDEFKLRFPVAKDRTLRRIGTIQLILVILMPLSFLLLGLAGNLSRRHDPRWPDIYGDVDINSPFYIAGFIPAVVLFLSILAIISASIVKSIIFTRRYGWRAVKDPIEAHRVAMREALYDVATGSTRPDVELEQNGDRLMVVPVRRLRPVGARLELTAERDKAQGPRGAK